MGYLLLIIAGCALMLWVNYLIAKEFYKAAQAKGYSEWKYLWLPFLLGATPPRLSATNCLIFKEDVGK